MTLRTVKLNICILQERFGTTYYVVQQPQQPVMVSQQLPTQAVPQVLMPCHGYVQYPTEPPAAPPVYPHIQQAPAISTQQVYSPAVTTTHSMVQAPVYSEQQQVYWTNREQVSITMSCHYVYLFPMV